MGCFDCAASGHTAVATAICTGCGAALCRQHSITTGRDVHRAGGMGRSSSPVQARRITCRICYGARRAA
ncbi:DUF2180 family protein [Streptomyces sp. IBSNAI002]|uniref:DUF2180 family protein n=1 Tax=Streptomyces sp. IBSNAI002 TaxID=3457500 RepID=UPI003FD48873